MRVPLNDLRRHTESSAGELLSAIERVLHSGWFVLGREVEAFEAEFADYCGRRYCVSVGSGYDALELSLRSLGIGHGDEVLTVANAGGFATQAILSVGARPLFVDVDSQTLTMSVDALHAVPVSRVRAAIVTHLYGRLADMEGLSRVAREKGLTIVEDCAQAHGARSDGRHAGGWGSVGCFSFYPTKNLGALGDGGAVVTDKPDVAEQIRWLRNYGWEKKSEIVVAGGRNSRLDEMQAAVLRVMLPQVEGRNQCRRDIRTRYHQALSHESLTWLAPTGEDDAAHLCVVRMSNRDFLRPRLESAGVETAIHYPVPDYRQPGLIELIGDAEPLEETEIATAEVLTLPNFPEMTDAEVDYVIATMRGCLDERGG